MLKFHLILNFESQSPQQNAFLKIIDRRSKIQKFTSVIPPTILNRNIDHLCFLYIIFVNKDTFDK